MSWQGLNKVFGAFGYVAWIAMTGCASAPDTPSSITEWRRVERTPGCESFSSHRGRPYDLSIELEPQFEGSLMDQLRQRQPEPAISGMRDLQTWKLEQPLCWYETPSGDVLLRAGNMCGFPTEAQFRRTEADWALVRFQQVWIQCDQKAR